MILGLGNDIIEIERIQKSIDHFGDHFLDRLFTKKEQAYCKKHKNPEIRFAGRFAAKEAISKALGTGIGSKISWLDLEILNDKTGKPIVSFLKEGFDEGEIHLAISHCKNFASAVAIWSSKAKR